MTLTIDDILVAADIGENTDWEFKSGRGGFPGSFWDTYSAMANADGGVVVLGIREDGDKVQLDGLSSLQISKYQKILWDSLNNRGKVSCNLISSDDVQILDVGGSLLLVIQIPRADRTRRPVYLGSNPFGHTYRRRHEGDYRCDDDEVRRMLADADPIPADHRILPNFGIGDLDAPSLMQYRQRFRAAKGDHPWLATEDKDFLEKIAGWRRDRTSGLKGLTLAGLIMFGKDSAIRDPEAAPNYFPDYREKLDPSTRWSDRIYPDGTWAANLFQFYQRVWPKLSAGLPVPFTLEGGVRRDETPAHEALREAFVNALIHADYAVGGGIVLERYPDRFILENPGTVLVSREQFRRGGVSECRNTALQGMFLMIGGGERAGSGVDRIRSGWRSRHWRAPLIRIQSQPDRVCLTLPMVSLIPDSTLRQLREVFGNRIDSLTPPELQALATAQIEGAVTNTRLQELLSDHPVDITRMLQRLCDHGYLVSDNRRRWSTYHLSKEGSQIPLFQENQAITEDSSHLAGDSSHLAEDSSHLAGDSIHLPQSEERLRSLATSVAGKGKAPNIEVREVILQLCDGAYLTTQQLAELLHRRPANLRSRFLAPMVREGLLRLRYPKSSNRPDQAYTRVDKS